MQEVETWKSKGDQVIIGMDANEDVRGGDTARIFAEMDMREVILEAHHDKSPPATCDKNTNREPIDGIFATPGIRIVAGGYSAFNSGCPSDHRYLWIDIPYEDAFGYAAPPLFPPSARRLKSKDLMMVQRYNSKVKLALTSEGLIEALETIKCQALAEGWSDKLEKEYNRTLDTLVIRSNLKRSSMAPTNHLQVLITTPSYSLKSCECLRTLRTTSNADNNSHT
jgi:hypothetical protein